MLRTFFAFFIPLFVAIDPVGLLPVFLGVTRGLSREQRRRAIFEAVAAAVVISIGFMFVGEALFRFLSVTDADFRIAGGVLLLVMSVYDILTPGKPAVDENATVGIVPLAMPLIVGPATMATVLILAKRPAGYSMTTLSLAINFLILLAVLLGSETVARVVGLNTLRAFSKLVMVLLSAIGVNYILTGLAQAFPQMVK
jgi:multiple antibiotic resistance protein